MCFLRLLNQFNGLFVWLFIYKLRMYTYVRIQRSSVQKKYKNVLTWVIFFFLYFKCQRPLNPYEPPQKTLEKKIPRKKNVYCNDFTILNFHKKVRRHTYSPQKISRKRLLNCQMIRVTSSQVTTLLKMNDIRYKV